MSHMSMSILKWLYYMPLACYTCPMVYIVHVLVTKVATGLAMLHSSLVDGREGFPWAPGALDRLLKSDYQEITVKS